MNRDQHRQAKNVIAWLAKAEDPDNPDYPVARIKAERWPEVCAAVEANPDLSAKTIAERLGAELADDHHHPPMTKTAEPSAGPVLTSPEVRERLTAIKAQLGSITKIKPEEQQV